AVNAAVLSTIRASAVNAESKSAEIALQQQGRSKLELVQQQAVGDRKAGVVWHTQGSGKSLSMVFYTGNIVLALDNPTVVVITDRNDLD
ncbi:DEAD/DEAH box helicase family protein, partial [Acinetobacter baumannii]